VVTLRAEIFNHPEHCTHGGDGARCGEGDLTEPDVDGSVVFVTSAYLRTVLESYTFEGRIAAGDASHVVSGGGLTNVKDADVYFVLLDHGPLIQGLYNEMSTTLRAGCTEAPAGTGTPGPNTCVDLQISRHTG
jgi:hypothetical protein